MSQQSWDDHFMELLATIAGKSKDPSTKCGAIIVYPDFGICSTGFNGFARGVEDAKEQIPERYTDRDVKLLLTIHAELNAIINSAKHGHCTQGCTIYVNNPPAPAAPETSFRPTSSMSFTAGPSRVSPRAGPRTSCGAKHSSERPASRCGNTRRPGCRPRSPG